MYSKSAPVEIMNMKGWPDYTAWPLIINLWCSYQMYWNTKNKVCLQNCAAVCVSSRHTNFAVAQWWTSKSRTLPAALPDLPCYQNFLLTSLPNIFTRRKVNPASILRICGDLPQLLVMSCALRAWGQLHAYVEVCFEELRKTMKTQSCFCEIWGSHCVEYVDVGCLAVSTGRCLSWRWRQHVPSNIDFYPRVHKASQTQDISVHIRIVSVFGLG
jgi:hypothetical protein